MRILFPFVALLVAVPVLGHAQERLSLDQCREMAIQNNHEIRAAQSQTESVQFTQKSYRANYLPSISLEAIGLYCTADGGESFDLSGAKQQMGAGFQQVGNGLMQNLGPILAQNPAAAQVIQQAAAQTSAQMQGMMGSLPNEIGAEYEVGPVFTAGIMLKQPIYMGGKIKNATKIAGMGVEMAQRNEVLTKANVVEMTDQAYALVVKAKEMQKVAKRYNDVLNELMSSVVKAKNQGLKTSNDVLKVQVKLNESELSMQKAANAVVLAKMNLCHVIGKDLGSDIDVADDFPSLEVRDGSVASRPEAAILAKKVEIAEAKADIEKSGIRPEVGAVLSYNYINGITYNTVVDGHAGEEKKLFDEGVFTALVKVSIPIFNFGKNTNKVRAAQRSLEQTRLERQNLTEKMELEQQRAKNNLDEANKEKVVAEKSLEQAAENMRASKSMYENGMETLSEYLEAQLLWQQAMATKVNAEYQLYLAVVDYNRTSGTLVD